jgi:hypothetical protein
MSEETEKENIIAFIILMVLIPIRIFIYKDAIGNLNDSMNDVILCSNQREECPSNLKFVMHCFLAYISIKEPLFYPLLRYALLGKLWGT